MKKLLVALLIVVSLGLFYKLGIDTSLLAEDKGISILVDPGHGGKDPGTIGLDGSYEKDLSLKIGLRLGEELEKNGYRVSYTRREDLALNPIDRVKIANDLGVDMILSIHCNATEKDPSVRGAQVLYYPSSNNRDQAQVLLDEIIRGTGALDGGVVERKDLILLNQSKMKSFIVEAGFLTNKKDLRKLESSIYREKLVASIVRGVDEIYR